MLARLRLLNVEEGRCFDDRLLATKAFVDHFRQKVIGKSVCCA